MKIWLTTINIYNNVLLFPVVLHWTEAGSPNPTEFLALTLKVYAVLGVRSWIVSIVIEGLLLISSGVPVILYPVIDSSPPPLSLGVFHFNSHELYLAVELRLRGSEGGAVMNRKK